MAFQHRDRSVVRTTQRPSRSLMNEKISDLLAQRPGQGTARFAGYPWGTCSRLARLITAVEISDAGRP